nr:immunoglobulin light chain junction region [Macaca mulatta]
CLQSRNSPWTC